MHEGKTVEEAKGEFATLLAGVDASKTLSLRGRWTCSKWRSAHRGESRRASFHYFAMCIEQNKDITAIRVLEGERRLLDEGEQVRFTRW